jgi:lysophospholipase L1-like esterase
VLSQSGVSHVIVHIGINDIGLSKLFPTQCPSAEDIIAALSDLAAKARDKNVLVIFGTLLPWRGATLFGASLYSDESEARRAAVNAWIRGNTEVHQVVDFDAVVRDPADPLSLEARFDTGDHLHCNDCGLEAMANAVDLDALR